LTGELTGGKVVYRPVTSCLTALGNVHQKHVVTIEGLNGEGLNFLQRMICEGRSAVFVRQGSSCR
jgi:xanthine dehydrogenase small subunit